MRLTGLNIVLVPIVKPSSIMGILIVQVQMKAMRHTAVSPTEKTRPHVRRG